MENSHSRLLLRQTNNQNQHDEKLDHGSPFEPKLPFIVTAVPFLFELL